MERWLYFRYEVFLFIIIFYGVLYYLLDNFKIRRNEWNFDVFLRCINFSLVWFMLKIELRFFYMFCSVEVGGKGFLIVFIWGF